MSEPTRYEAMGPEVIATPTGEFVMWEDYAFLKMEVERLRKAGDAMAFALANGDRKEYGGLDDSMEEYMGRKEIKDWLAAKENHQS